jgi:hypothetical protein
MRHEPLTDELIASLASSTDEFGWLSIYIDASPQRQNSNPAEWVTPVRTGLAEEYERAKAEGPRERWRAFDERMDDLETDLAELLDPRAPGRGRALFAPLSGGEAILVVAQVPFADHVSLSDSPVIQPLVTMIDRHRPVGLAAIHRRGVFVAESRLGTVEEVAGASFWIDTDDWREMRGPAGANPALPQQSSNQTDKFDRRMDEHVNRRLRELSGVLVKNAADRGWDHLFLIGDPRLTAVLRDEVSPEGRNGGPDVIEVEKVAPDPDAHELAELVEETRGHVEADRQHRLVERALGAAAAADGGATGHDQVLEAFLAGRVERVVVSEEELTDEMVRAAIDTSAAVTVVEGEAADALADNGGVVALLRW